ncbi:UDP-galactopyranose mutase [Iodidimonas sp. SYSU 1G8]|uniref:UDP-galactopyranose mutase n=1 Tax=Iodidimonas sp. SYSU 1G8 TaxID=3133967 RepID=UPI0031FE9476
MTRLARTYQVVYFEEPVWVSREAAPGLNYHHCAASGVTVVTPRLPEGAAQVDVLLRELLDGLLGDPARRPPVLWYYTPMMLDFSRHVPASLVVYDCMDELSNFRFAASDLGQRESDLLRRADVVFTGGYSLYEAKRDRHVNIHPFPSSVDKAHFAQARDLSGEAAEDQRGIPGPRLGYFGVIDERLDLALLAALADARPDWSIIMVGPVVKIDPAELPQRPNIHYLGGKSYEALPEYLAGWDVALMPFAMNEATRFISPTKTPEYLAGGKPVVSTPVFDVVRRYTDLPAVHIAADTGGFIAACDAALAMAGGPGDWLKTVDEDLAHVSWDATVNDMSRLMDEAALSQGDSGHPAARQGRRKVDYLVVGAGFAGSVLAERLAAGLGRKVMVIDKRPHVGGNAYDRKDAAGLLIHQYGPHIFHTNSADIVQYLSRFTEWRPYEHRVLAACDGTLVPIPINRTTLNAVYGLDLADDAAAAAFLAARAEPRLLRTSEDVVIASVGRDLYERFFRGYTRKQWGMDPSELDKSVTARVPTRTNTDDRYFTDAFQQMPAEGYTRMFERMLDHENIEVRLGTSYAEIIGEVEAGHVIYTGPIDEFFDFRFGKLPYRSLRFRHETLDQEWLQPVAVVNYPDEAVAHTRVTEYKHLTGQTHPRTSITYEYPADAGDPYYPIPRPENQALFKRYEALAAATPGVTFVGRLGTYKYYNMDQVVGQALATFRRIAARTASAGGPAPGDEMAAAAE